MFAECCDEVNKTELQIAWQAFTAHFHNPAMQENIRNLKEEEYQEGFVRDLFVNIIGFTLNPQPAYNLGIGEKISNRCYQKRWRYFIE